MPPGRVFLGWDRPLLPLAADWLVRERRAELADLILVVPGRRAARRLEELLLERLGKDGGLLLPDVLTAGALTDRLLRLDRPVAPRLLRTLVWIEALKERPRPELAALWPAVPDPDQLPAWLALAEPIRALHAELQEAGLDFGAVAGSAPQPVPEDLARRWRVLAALQERFLTRVVELGFVDPHAGRNAALRAGHIDRARHVVLIGVAELGGIQRRLVAALGSTCTALVFAPGARAPAFDEHGCVRPAGWLEAELPLGPDGWLVVDKPADQAAAAVGFLARQAGATPLSVSEVAVGVPDAEVVPFLEQALRSQGVAARNAGGMPIERTVPWRLLHAVAALLATRRYAELAALVRQPDFEERLRRELFLAGHEPLAVLDKQFEEHLPDRAVELTAPVWQAALDVLGRLGRRERLPLRLWAERVAAFLQDLCGRRPLEQEHDAGHRAAEALGVLGEVLRGLHELPEALDGTTQVGAATALQVLLRATAGETVAPESGADAVELLGWLELLHDDSKALVITGCNEGRVPEPARRSPLLDAAWRQALGLSDRDQRAARDLYVLHALLCSRAHVQLVSGRRSQVGDPLVPSRLLFAGTDATAHARLRAALEATQAPAPEPWSQSQRPALPRIEPIQPPEAISVTAFKRYLQSPYGFYLEQMLKLRGVEDVARELDAKGYGKFLHEVLQRFGQGPARDVGDEDRVRAALREQLEVVTKERFAGRPRPAVRLQLQQAALTLDAFARWQARRAVAGWRIAHAEWKQAGVPFEVDGKPILLKGRVDRIDHHPQLGWAILDYKTSPNVQEPDASHRKKDGTWTDLQLPLYRKLVEPLALRGDITLAYVCLPRAAAETGDRAATWTESDLQSAFAAAADVVRRIRALEFDEVGRWPPDDPILAAVCGQGLLAGMDEVLESEP